MSNFHEFWTLCVQNCTSGPSARSRRLTLKNIITYLFVMNCIDHSASALSGELSFSSNNQITHILFFIFVAASGGLGVSWEMGAPVAPFAARVTNWGGGGCDGFLAISGDGEGRGAPKLEPPLPSRYLTTPLFAAYSVGFHDYCRLQSNVQNR